MKQTILTIFLFVAVFAAAQQEHTTEKIWRVNIINPSVEVDLPITSKIVQTAALGVGYSGSYPELSAGGGSGFVYVISPFVDTQTKYFYNFNKRIEKGKNVTGNAGNFLSFRVFARGPSIVDNIFRKGTIDVAFGPTWGIQRAYGKFHLLFDVGPQIYFDNVGNIGFWPVMPQINIGFNL